MKITLNEYKVIFNRPGFAEVTEKYTTAPTDEDAKNILQFMVNKVNNNCNIVSIEKYCPYTKTWSRVIDED